MSVGLPFTSGIRKTSFEFRHGRLVAHSLAQLKLALLTSRFMQKIRPDLMPKYKKYEMAAKQRENVAMFSKCCEQMGVRDTDLFQTIDLFERKDPVAVANCISRLGSIVSFLRTTV